MGNLHADGQLTCWWLLFAVLQDEQHSSDTEEQELDEDFDRHSECKELEHDSSSSEESAFIRTGRHIV